MRGLRPGRSLLLQLLLPTVALAQAAPTDPVRATATVDHVPIAVRSLDDARRTYESLGFRLKPGRLHANGLRNAFAKFPGGDYLELITPERGATDAVTAQYASVLARGEGGAFLALRTDSLPQLARRLQAARHGVEVQRYGGAFSTLSFADPALDWLFLIEYLVPVEDPPALLDHPNSARGIESVWLTEPRYTSLRSLQGTLAAERVEAAGPGGGLAASVAGVTLRVRSLDAAREAVRAGTGLDLPIRVDARGRSLLVPASHAHGIWIEFLEHPTGQHPG